MEKLVFYSFKQKQQHTGQLLKRPISNNFNVSLLGLRIENYLTWKDHMDELVVKLNKSCFAVQSVKSILSLETLNTVYYSYVHYILYYGG
jgi:hypothetical protein